MLLAKLNQASHSAHLSITLRSAHLIQNDKTNLLKIEKEQVPKIYYITSNTSDIKSRYFDNSIRAVDKYIWNNNQTEK